MHGLYGKVRMLVFAAALTCGCVEVGGGAAASRNVSSAPLSRSKIDFCGLANCSFISSAMVRAGNHLKTSARRLIRHWIGHWIGHGRNQHHLSILLT